jgi:exodeoxyribonuclease-3
LTPRQNGFLLRLTRMRIATWNVNSLKARLEKVEWWALRASPDVLLLQETKCTDDGVPREPLEKLGYHLVHHGSGGRNGVAILSRTPLTDVVTNFGEPLAAAPAADAEAGGSDYEPMSEARMIAGVTAGIRFVSLYAPNGRTLPSPFYEAKLVWFERLSRWLAETQKPSEALVLGGDFNIAPADLDVWDPKVAHGGTHVSPRERERFAQLLSWGLVDGYRQQHEEGDRYSWWDYRAGDFHRNVGMRIDHLLLTKSVAARSVAAEIDREARKGKPIPSDHAPVSVDLDAPGQAFDPGWASAAERIAARRAKVKR